MSKFRTLLTSGSRIIFDGAMGTMLQARGLAPGQSPEEFCLAKPDVLEGVHNDYIAAGADVLTTNTFGGSRFKLPPGLNVKEFNRRMTHAARAAADRSSRQVFVAGSVGPSGKFLYPLGDLSFEELVDGFREQIRGLIEGGADLIIAETQFDIAEARAIVIATRKEGDLPVAVSMTYEDGVTLTGSSVEVCAATLANMSVDFIGMNCSAGPQEMRTAVEELLRTSPMPVLIQPNAGLPILRDDGQTVFPLGPVPFAELTGAFARDGAQLVGGCCGTTPEHIAALRGAAKELSAPAPRPEFSGIAVTSRSRLVRIGEGYPLCIIGERINPTGKKQLTAELQAGEYSEALRLAEEQVMAGSPILDVNVGAPMVDEVSLLPDLVQRIAAMQPVPLSIDSSSVEAVEKSLAFYPASPLVNSISGEEGKMEFLGPLCRNYGAPFILLPLQGKKIPVKYSERVAIVEDLLHIMEQLGIPRRLAIVDALILTVSSSPEAGRECLRFIKHCSNVLGLPTVCGLSNISFGLPARELINSTYLSLAAGSGLNVCIANPRNFRTVETVDASNLLLGLDQGAENFISRYAQWKGHSGFVQATTQKRLNVGEGQEGSLGEIQAFGSIEEAIIMGKRGLIAMLVQTALEKGTEPFVIVGERLIPAITEVGAKYERKEYFLPQLIRSAETMQTAFDLLRPFLEKDGRASVRKVIIMATVEGDIHDIGKNIACLMLGNHGFEVVDLGKDVSASVIVETAVERQASIIGLSALMTTTMVRMKETIELLKGKNLDIQVMVGGAVVTDDFARSIGAYYAKDAVDAVRLAKYLSCLMPEDNLTL